jgi:hypothetical protein
METDMPEVEKSYTIDQYVAALGGDKELITRLMTAAYEPQEWPKYLGDDQVTGLPVIAKSADDQEAHAVKLKA